jgi:putative DNA primase/helicase
MLVGESNHAATDLKNLEQNRFEAATLYGKRLAVISDSSRYGGKVSVLKAITGGDPIRHERKNQQQNGSFVFEGIVMIASNEPIQSSDYSSGLARRRMPINFIRKISDTDKEKWRTQGGIEHAMKLELPGLLNWVLAMTDDELNAVIGGIEGKLNKSQRLHLCETNKLAQWIDDNLFIQVENKIYSGGSPVDITDSYDLEVETKTKLYPNYYKWCKTNGNMPISVNRFMNCLEDIATHARLPIQFFRRDNAGRYCKGFAIREERHANVTTPITEHSLTQSDDEIAISVGKMTYQVIDCVNSVNKTTNNAEIKKTGNKERF